MTLDFCKSLTITLSVPKPDSGTGIITFHVPRLQQTLKFSLVLEIHLFWAENVFFEEVVLLL